MPRAIPGRRYYGGCEYVDVVEDLARDRAKQLFGAEHANVQPHSGSQANFAVYLTAIQPGDTVLGLDLAHGGHLTHGMKLNISGMLYHFISYGVTRDTHRIDFDQVAALAREHKPKLIVAGASAYPREIPHGKFAEIAREVGAKLFVDMAHYAGLVAAGLHDNPVPVADFVTTTTHKTLRGPRAGLVHVQGRVRQGSRPHGVPRHPGRAADARRSPARRSASARRCSPSSSSTPRQIIDNAKALADALLAGGLRLVSGGTDNHLMLVDVTTLGLGGKQAEAVLEQLRHHGQQEHDPLRRAQADGPLAAFASARRP